MKANIIYLNRGGCWFGTEQTVIPHSCFRRLAGTLPGILLGLAFLPLAALGQANYATPYTFTTLAGSSGYGSADGTNIAARFALPCGAAADSAGNVYVADVANSTIRKMTPVGADWVVTTLVGLAGCPGTNDGVGSAARLCSPNGVTVDNAGNLYVADSGNNTIRKATAIGTNWVVTTLAGLAGRAGTNDGTGSAARFYEPLHLAVDGAGDVYVADTFNHTIRQVTPAGVVTTLAGLAGSSGTNDGTGSTARFNRPCGVAVDSAGNLYVADTLNCTIRQVTSSGTVTTLAGLAGIAYSADGTGSAARFNYPYQVAVDTNGNVYVADKDNNTIRKVTSSGTVTTLAGHAGYAGANDGVGSYARFYRPNGVAVDTSGNVFVADTLNETIRKVTPVGPNWVVSTLAGLAGDSAGSTDGTGSAARFNLPTSVSVDTNGNVYVADYNNSTIRKVTPSGLVSTLAGLAGWAGINDGTGSSAQFNYPCGVAVNNAGNVYVCDTGSSTIRKVTPAGVVTTLAGLAGSSGTNDGTGSAAKFYKPCGMAADNAGNLFVADYGNHTIRKLTPVGTNWVVTTLAGLGGSIGSADGTNSAARFNYPFAVAVDSIGNLFVADEENSTIRKVTPVGVVTTLAGVVGSVGAVDGTGSAAVFDAPFGVAVDSTGNVYVADFINNTIRKGFLASAVPLPNLQPPSLSASQFSFGITGVPNLPVNIESSSDLAHWQVVGTCCLLGCGTNCFVSPNLSVGAQFYRIHVR